MCVFVIWDLGSLSDHTLTNAPTHMELITKSFGTPVHLAFTNKHQYIYILRLTYIL